jgi:hypothetical protein
VSTNEKLLERKSTMEFSLVFTLVSTVTPSFPLLGTMLQQQIPDLALTSVISFHTNSQQRLNYSCPLHATPVKSQKSNYVTTDGQSVYFGVNLIWDPRPDFCHFHTVGTANRSWS